MVRSQNGHEMTVNTKDLFTPNVRDDSRIGASVNAWKEYTGLNCITHTKR